MHELSIVLNIIKIAEEQVRLSSAKKVDAIELDIGVLSGVEMSAFEFAWQAAVPQTVLADAKQKINRIPGKAKCLVCNLRFEVKTLYELCPECSDFNKEIEQGKVLKVKNLLVS